MESGDLFDRVQTLAAKTRLRVPKLAILYPESGTRADAVPVPGRKTLLPLYADLMRKLSTGHADYRSKGN